MDLKSLFNQYDFNLKYAEALLENVSKEQMCFTPAHGLENHPAFTIGHLCTASALLAEDLGDELEMPEGWFELFVRKGPGDPRFPEPEANKYPSKESLLKEFERQHNKVKQVLLRLNKEELDSEIKWRFHKFMSSKLDLAVFMCINHEAMHLGQIASWRRAMNMPSALAAL